jgi:hypothetical protein
MDDTALFLKLADCCARHALQTQDKSIAAKMWRLSELLTEYALGLNLSAYALVWPRDTRPERLH